VLEVVTEVAAMAATEVVDMEVVEQVTAAEMVEILEEDLVVVMVMVIDKYY
jgi:hypothetical protein